MIFFGRVSTCKHSKEGNTIEQVSAQCEDPAGHQCSLWLSLLLLLLLAAAAAAPAVSIHHRTNFVGDSVHWRGVSMQHIICKLLAGSEPISPDSSCVCTAGGKSVEGHQLLAPRHSACCSDSSMFNHWPSSTRLTVAQLECCSRHLAHEQAAVRALLLCKSDSLQAKNMKCRAALTGSPLPPPCAPMPPAGPDARMTSRLLLLVGACICTVRLLAAAGCTRCVDRDSMFRRSELGLLVACWQHMHGRVDADKLLICRCSIEAEPRASMLLLLLLVH
jgi:hypothetical protein